VLEKATATLDSFTAWKLEVGSSFSSVKLELVKLNSFFDWDAKAASAAQPGVLANGSATARPPARSTADGPVGHRVESSHRDRGVGRINTQIRDPIMGTIFPPPPPLDCPFRDQSALACSSDSRLNLGKLPKMNFPIFDPDHPKLWQSCCETYFYMYGVDQSVWVRVASMHFEGPAAQWLQSMNHRIRSATWTELYSWIHDRFGRDQHESLIR
jgi:hypothetical protein